MFKLLSTTILTIAALLLFAAPFSFEVSGDALSISENIVVAQGETPEGNGLVDEKPSLVQQLSPHYQLGVFLLKTIGAVFLTLGAAIMWLTGILLNYGIAFSIIDFNTFATISGVSIAWTVLRDIANVFFIFIFLAIGISTILGLQQYGAKKLLPLLLIIAVLINFSLFFAKAGVDIAHGFAGAILNQSGVAANNCEDVLQAGSFQALAGRQGAGINCMLTHGVAAAFIEQFGFLSYFGESFGLNSADDEIAQTRSSDAGGLLSVNTLGEASRAMFFGIFAFIFMSAAGIVFLGGAIILFMRIVKILILLITSAPAMAAYILPGTRRFWNSWLEEFLKEVFFAPIFLLLIAISLLFLNTARGALSFNSDVSFASLFIHGGVETVSLVMFFFIALGFLFMSLKLAQDMKISGAKTAMNVRNFGTRQLSSLTLGAAAAGGRQFIGRPAHNVAEQLGRTKFSRTGFGRFVTDNLKGVADASYDPRKFAPDDVAGKAGKGYTGRAKDREKEILKYGKDLKLTPEEEIKKREAEDAAKKSGTAAQNTETETKEKEREFSMAKVRRVENDAKLEIAKKDGNQEDIAKYTSAKAAFTSEEESLKREIAELKKQTAESKSEQKSFESQATQIKSTPQAELADNLESETSGKTVIFDNPEDRAFNNRLEQQMDGLRDEIRTASEKEREVLNRKLTALTETQNEHIKKNGRYEMEATGRVGQGLGGFAGAGQGNIAGAKALRKAIKDMDDDKAKDRDALAKALKDAVKDN